MSYIVFTIIHYAANIGDANDGTRYIYAILDWGNIPASIGYTIAVTLVITSFHILALIASKVTISTRNKEEPDSHSGDVTPELELPPAE